MPLGPSPCSALSLAGPSLGEAGTTLYRVGAVKDLPGIRKYVTVDGGMGATPGWPSIRRSMRLWWLIRPRSRKTQIVSVAGKCCESGDMLIWDLEAPDVVPGDILAVFCTGAYTYSMASNYNRLPVPRRFRLSRVGGPSRAAGDLRHAHRQ